MTILGLKIGRKKTEEPIDPAVEAALRRRLDERVKTVGSAQRPAAHGAMREDSRTCRREPVYRVGAAMFDVGHETSCRVTNQSFSGLRLSFHDDAVVCPDEFALSIPTLRFIGVVRKAWQKESEVGVAILRWSDAA